MRKVAVIAALGLVAVSACSVKSSGGGGGSATPTGDPRSTGVTATAIKLGITTLDLKALGSVISLDHGDAKTAFTALIDNINAHGGINGRKIVPYFAAVNPVGTDPAAAACTKLTEDDKVFAVLGYFGNGGNDALCYLKTHDTPIIGTSLSPAQERIAKAPWFNAQLTNESLITKALGVFNSQGAFTGHKVAVVGMATDADDLNKVAVPTLRKLGVNVVQSAINTASPNDLPSQYQQFNLIIQKFKAAGADTVVTVGQANLTWPRALQVLRSSYKPRLVGLDSGTLNTYANASTGFDASVLKGAVAAGGGMPDITLPNVWSLPSLQSCLALITAAHPSEPIGDPVTAKPNGAKPWVNADSACQQVNLFADIVRAAGKDLTNATFNSGGESLHNVSLPGALQALHFGPNAHDGDLPVTVSTWNAATKTFDQHTVTGS